MRQHLANAQNVAVWISHVELGIAVEHKFEMTRDNALRM